MFRYSREQPRRSRSRSPYLHHERRTRRSRTRSKCPPPREGPLVRSGCRSKSRDSSPYTLDIHEPELPSDPLIESALQVRNEILETAFGDPEHYSTGEKYLQLRFPSLNAPTDRFDLDTYGMFQFLPRRAFGDIWDLITRKLLMPYRFEKLMIYGSMGSGKSYLMSSLVCFLVKRGRGVIYIPDCQTFAEKPHETLLKAFLVAFADDIQICKKLKHRFDVNEEGFVQFLRDELKGVMKGCHRIFVIADQINALDPKTTDDPLVATRKLRAQRILQKITINAHLITSSADHSATQFVSNTSSASVKYQLAGGLRPEELDFWFISNRSSLPASLSDTDKREMLHLSGGVPLFLFLTKGSNLDAIFQAGYYAATHDEIRSFVNRMVEDTNSVRVKNFLKTMESCMLEDGEFVGRAELKDPRYFYYREGKGVCINGFVQRTLARCLREIAWEQQYPMFLTPTWFAGLISLSHNPSVLDFLVEEMVIETMAQVGFMSLEEVFIPASDICKFFFNSYPPRIQHEEGYGLYLPTRYSPTHINCYIIHLQKEERECMIIPVQVTIAKRHKCSDEDFYTQAWRKWRNSLECLGYNVKLAFLWVVERNCKVIEEQPFAYDRHMVGIRYVSKTVAEHLARVREAQDRVW